MSIQQVTKSVNTFIEKSSKNKLWVIGWFVFAAAVTFVVRFFVDYPNQQALMNNNTAKFNTYTQDYDEFLQTGKLLTDSYGSFMSIIKEYDSIIDKANNKKNVSLAELKQAKTNAELAKLSFGTAIGTLSGIQFNDGKLDKYIESFQLNLENKDEIVDVILMFYQGLLDVDQEKVNKAASAIRDYNIDVYRQEAEAIETMNNFSKEFENFHAKSIIEIDKETSNLVIYRYKSKLVVLALAYSVIFSLAGVYAWSKNVRFAQKKGKKKANKKK